MTQDANQLSAEIILRSDQLKDQINKLMDAQEEVREDILELQMRKRQGQSIDETLLTKLKKVRKKSSQTVGLPALERTELLNDLPIIRLASGKIKVIASELAQDADLIARTADKLQQVTKRLQKAEKLLVKMIGLVGIIQ